MRLSRYFLPVMKETPAEARVVSHRLMLRAGMIRQATAGIYTWLPLGLKVLKRVCALIDEEMQRAGALPILMPTIQPADLWRESGRYDAYGAEMLRLRDRHDRELLYGPTNEEMVTDIFRRSVSSYKDLPLNLYHIQWKFRDEIRPRFGVMRGREFMMKDAYSFDLTHSDAIISYNRMMVAYIRIFERLGLKALPVRADTGPIGGDHSHEFLILADTGESEVFVDSEALDLTLGAREIDFDDADQLAEIAAEWTRRYARTDDTHDPVAFEAETPEARRRTARGIEVAHIFNFGAKYSEAMRATVSGPGGEQIPVEMGSYGIGPSRLVAALIEANHDDAGVMWPAAVAPFDVGVVNLKQGDPAADRVSETLYAALTAAGLDPLYDDRAERAGSKFATMDLIGLPWRVTVGPRGLARGVVELVRRRDGAVEEASLDGVVARLAEVCRA